jgi:NarL family two-component system sensor histidine kinase YdfH
LEEKKRFEAANDLMNSRIPINIWIVLVYISTVIIQFIIDVHIISGIIFTGLFALHIVLHWNAHRITQKSFWAYFFIQGIIIYLCSIVMPDGYQAVLIGLLPTLIAQSLSFSLHIKKVIFITLISIIIFLDSVLTIEAIDQAILFICIFILMLFIVIGYAVLFLRQVQERIRIQNYLRDLQEAHQKVEELTLANERQRMARDLHDTLAQGVAGLIMQLEAADAYFTKGNSERAQQVVKQSMQQARRSLAEARRAIDNLRLKSAPEVDFKEAMSDEVRRFKEATGISVMTNFQFNIRVSTLIMEHSLHIVKECLTNVARHAQANMVWITLSDENERIWIEVTDNGIGFDVDTIGKKTGHYGILGLQERARLIGGELNVFSNWDGTTIWMKIPLGNKRT